jgi:hypothetical protein
LESPQKHRLTRQSNKLLVSKTPGFGKLEKFAKTHLFETILLGFHCGHQRNMKRHLILIIFLASHTIFAQKQSAPPTDWKLVSECSIEFYIPSDFKEEKVQPIDSCVLKYQNGKTVMLLDVLGYITPDESRKDEYSDNRDFTYVKTKIDGRKAEIITVLESDEDRNAKGLNYAAVLFVPQMRKDGGNLTIWINSVNEEERKKAMQIYQTVRFPKVSEK